MPVNRNIAALKPELAATVKRFLVKCAEQDLSVVIIETDRTQAVQDAYYAQGRQTTGTVNSLRKAAGLYPLTDSENKIITNAKVSNHTGGNAVDIAPEKIGLRGYPWWNAPQSVWEEIGALAEQCGLDWCAGGYGQTWGKGWDNPHFELMR
jgi:hypothetical protein